MKKITLTILLAVGLIISGCSSETKQTENNDSETEKSASSQEKEEKPQLPDTELKKGDTGDAVSALQYYLTEIGYPIHMNESFDDLTTWALTDLQLQHDDANITGTYDEQTKNVINDILDGNIEITPEKELNKPENPDQFTEEIENPYEILSLINKQYALPSDYKPKDLVVPEVRFPFEEDVEKKQLRKVAADALEEMFKASEAAGLELFAQSGFRSYDRQEAIFATNVDQHGEDAANKFSARPGESEHQSGLVMDVTSPGVNYELVEEFGETDEGKWVKEHAHEYGFIIRYPKGKESITKYQFEPWHLRYVGKQAAEEIVNKDITLEEYLGAIE